ELIHGARPAAAREVLARYEALAARAAQAKLTLEPDLASVWATFGRGMIGLGELDTARDHLERSITRRPTLAALEAVATIAAKRGADDAAARFELAMAAADDGPLGRFERARLQRLLGEAHAAAGARKS